MTLEQVLAEMQARFTSGNSIAVERAMIRREEWDVIVQALGDHAERLEAWKDAASGRLAQ